MQTSQKMKLSVIIPVYNDAANIVHNIERIKERLDFLQLEYELIIVDDGSNDATWPQIVRHLDPNKCFTLERNFGKGAAFLYGYKYAEGDYICLMDSDAQI